MRAEVRAIELRLKRDFIIAGGHESRKRNFVLVMDGLGLGEASGSIHYGVTPDEIDQHLGMAVGLLSKFDAPEITGAIESLGNTLCAPAMCALSTAWHDLDSKRKGLPLYKNLGLDVPQTMPTSITISVGDRESLAEQLELGFSHIKVKMDHGDSRNRAMIAIMNASAEAHFRIDANGSWNYDDAMRVVSAVDRHRVELIEQPFAPEAVDSWKRLREKTGIPLFMDESVVSAEDVKRVAEYVDGVNIKIQKSGRLETAIEAIRTARSLGLKVMLGCMIESSVGIAAAWHLSALADYLDLDGRLLVENDPFSGLTYDKGKIRIANEFGHGVVFA